MVLLILTLLFLGHILILFQTVYPVRLPQPLREADQEAGVLQEADLAEVEAEVGDDGV